MLIDDSLISELLTKPRMTRASPTNPRNVAFEFYKEVLLSYRLIFGQDKRSRKAWRRHCYKELMAFSADIADPLLEALCGKDCRNELTYEKIEAPEIAQQYSARNDFPFFGERLVEIQQFVLKKSPGDWTTLWNDRRDLRKYAMWLYQQ
jgi:hypothetical protein